VRAELVVEAQPTVCQCGVYNVRVGVRKAHVEYQNLDLFGCRTEVFVSVLKIRDGKVFSVIVIIRHFGW
jgi:hypothetical protein